MLGRGVSAATYLGVYAFSAVLFTIVAEPELSADYFRIAAFAATVLVVIWTIEVAVVHSLNWRCDKRRQHGQSPAQVWGMGIAFLLALTAVIRDVINLLHEPIRPTALPLLIATLAAATFWLWPLRRKLHQRHAHLTSDAYREE